MVPLPQLLRVKTNKQEHQSFSFNACSYISLGDSKVLPAKNSVILSLSLLACHKESSLICKICSVHCVTVICKR
jgi:hypothetical protein